jgi:hypothetical protein
MINLKVTVKSLYLAGAVAVLIAALGFRRNLGAAELPLLLGQTPPDSVVGWFTLLQTNSLLGLSYLNFFDLINYALVAVVFVALYVALRQTSKPAMACATIFGFVGVAVYFASNSALSMLSLSSQYTHAATETQKAALITAGQAALSVGFDHNAVYPSAGIFASLLCIALAGLIISAVMLKSRLFGKAVAYVGLLAAAFDLTYLVGLAFVPPPKFTCCRLSVSQAQAHC